MFAKLCKVYANSSKSFAKLTWNARKASPFFRKIHKKKKNYAKNSQKIRKVLRGFRINFAKLCEFSHNGVWRWRELEKTWNFLAQEKKSSQSFAKIMRNLTKFCKVYAKSRKVLLVTRKTLHFFCESCKVNKKFCEMLTKLCDDFANLTK